MDKKEPIYIAFGNQKGGVGKTTLAELLASLLHYEMGYKVFVVDCDDGQHSFATLRERDLREISSREQLQSQLAEYYETRGVVAYDVFASSVEDAVRLANEKSEGGDIDVVIFDLPGRADSTSMFEFVINMDYLIVPVDMDRQSLATSLTFARMMQRTASRIEGAHLKGIYILWNRVKSAATQDVIYEYNDKFREQLELNVFNSLISDMVRFRYGFTEVKNLSEAFRSTFVAPRMGARSGTGLNEFLREVMSEFFDKEEIAQEEVMQE